MASYKITGKRFVRKYTAANKTPTYAAGADAVKVAESLCEVPWSNTSPDVVATFPAHSGNDKTDGENVTNRDWFDAALFCGEHANGMHRAFANGACYRFTLPDAAVGVSLTELKARIFSDPYNAYGARVALFTSSSPDVPMACATCRKGSSADESTSAQSNNGTESTPATEWYSTNTHVEGVAPRRSDGTGWFANAGAAFIRPAGGLELQKYLFVFVLLERYDVARNGYLEGSSYSDPKFDITLSAAVQGLVEDEVNDCSAAEPVEFNVARGGVLPSLVTGVSGVQVCDVLGNGDPVVGDTVRSFGQARFVVGKSAPTIAALNGRIERVYLSNVWNGDISLDGETRNVTVQFAAVVGDFADMSFGFRGLRIIQVMPFAGAHVLSSTHETLATGLPVEVQGAKVKYADIRINGGSFTASAGSVWAFKMDCRVRIATENGFLDADAYFKLCAKEAPVEMGLSYIDQEGHAIGFRPNPREHDEMFGHLNFDGSYFRKGNYIYSIGEELIPEEIRWCRRRVEWPVGSILAANKCKYLRPGSSKNADFVCVLNRKQNASGSYKSFVYCFYGSNTSSNNVDVELPFDIVSGRVDWFGMPNNVASTSVDVNLVKGFVSGSFDYVSDGVSRHTERGVIFDENTVAEMPEGCDMLYRSGNDDILKVANENHRRRYYIENAESKIAVGVDRCVGLRAAYNRLYSSDMKTVAAVGSSKVGAAFAVRIEPSVLDVESDSLVGVSSRVSILSSIVTIPFSCPVKFVANRIRLDWESWSGSATAGSLFNVWLKRDSYLTDIGEDVVKDGRLYTADGGPVSGFELIGRVDAASADRSVVLKVAPLMCKNATILLSAFVSMDCVNPGANDETITAGVGEIDGANEVAGGWMPDVTLIG